MEINRAYRLGEIVNPAAISTYFTKCISILFHETPCISTLFQLYFYLVPGTWYIVLFCQIRNPHMRLNQVRTRLGHNFSGFLADSCFPMVQIGTRTY